MTTLADGSIDGNLVLGIIALCATVIGTGGTVGYWIVSSISSVKKEMEVKHLDYDAILETVVGKQAILESRHNETANRLSVVETKVDAFPLCAAREHDQGKFPRRT